MLIEKKYIRNYINKKKSYYEIIFIINSDREGEKMRIINYNCKEIILSSIV